MEGKDFLTVATDEMKKNVGASASVTGIVGDRWEQAKQSLIDIAGYNIRKTIYKRPFGKKLSARFI